MAQTILQIFEETPDEAIKGKRWELMVNLILRLCAAGLAKYHIESIAQSANLSRCKPPHTSHWVTLLVAKQIDYYNRIGWAGNQVVATPPSPKKPKHKKTPVALTPARRNYLRRRAITKRRTLKLSKENKP